MLTPQPLRGAANTRPWVLRSARVLGRPTLVDISIHGRRIQQVTPSRARTSTDTHTDTGIDIDIEGRIVLPGLVNAHAHVDKYAPHQSVGFSAGGEIRQLIEHERRHRTVAGLPHEAMVEEILRTMSRFGTTHIRSHTDIDPDVGLRGVEAVLAAAERLRDRITVEQVAFPQSGIVGQPGVAELLEEALRLGVGTIGGLDPASLDNDPVAHLDVVFGLAEKHGARVDIHLHDPGSLGLWQFGLIAERTEALSLAGRVAISHGFALSSADPAQQDAVLGRMRSAGVALHACVGFDDPVPPATKMRDAGVRLALGTDGVRDLWSPYGSGDLLERVAQLSYRSGFTHEHEFETALRAITVDAAASLGLDSEGITEGGEADLVVVDGASLTRAVIDHPPRHLVVKSGRVVA
jgi:cytosine/creatinine deaminase